MIHRPGRIASPHRTHNLSNKLNPSHKKYTMIIILKKKVGLRNVVVFFLTFCFIKGTTANLFFPYPPNTDTHAPKKKTMFEKLKLILTRPFL